MDKCKYCEYLQWEGVSKYKCYLKPRPVKRHQFDPACKYFSSRVVEGTLMPLGAIKFHKNEKVFDLAKNLVTVEAFLKDVDTDNAIHRELMCRLLACGTLILRSEGHAFFGLVYKPMGGPGALFHVIRDYVEDFKGRMPEAVKLIRSHL